MSLMYDLREFLTERGYANVCAFQYPDEPDEIISLHEREAPLAFGFSGINYGIRAAPVQIRIRRKAQEDAEADAMRLFDLLDSGPDEESIALAPGRTVTSRPKPPFFLEIDGKGRCVWVLKTTIMTTGL